MAKAKRAAPSKERKAAAGGSSHWEASLVARAAKTSSKRSKPAPPDGAVVAMRAISSDGDESAEDAAKSGGQAGVKRAARASANRAKSTQRAHANGAQAAIASDAKGEAECAVPRRIGARAKGAVGRGKDAPAAAKRSTASGDDAEGVVRQGRAPADGCVLDDDIAKQEPAPQAEIRRNVRYFVGFDGFADGRIDGWAIDSLRPHAPLELHLEIRGAPALVLSTNAPRPGLGAVAEGNVAGFSVDLAWLQPEIADALAEALKQVDFDAPTPAHLAAFRLIADNALFGLGAMGLTAGDLLRGLEMTAPSRKKPLRSREAIALDCMVAHLDGGEPGGRSGRRFTGRLLAEIEASRTVSASVKHHVRAIAPLFDPFHYFGQLAEPEEAAANPLLHYALVGWRGGLSPHPLFAPDYYVARRGADVKCDPLLDFLREGAARDVDPHPLFDMGFYRARWLGGDRQAHPLLHYLDIGGRLRFDPSPRFDTRAFLRAAQAGVEMGTPLETYVTEPRCWDYPIEPAFDATLYRHQIEAERGMRLAEPAFAHYLARGFRDETLLPNILFDPVFYRERNRLDFAGPALEHYLTEGEARGLACHPHFAPGFYNAERGVEGSVGALAHALAHPGMHRSDPRMERPIDPRVTTFIAGLVAERGEEAFDLDIYRQDNADMAHEAAEAAENHFRRHGRKEGRIASLTRFMRTYRLGVRDLPLGFVLADYTSIYPDLAEFDGRFLAAFFHYGRYGRSETRLVGKWQFHIDGLSLAVASAGAPLQVARRSGKVDVCILIHAFYPDLLPELVGFAQNFRDVSFDIFVNVVDLAWTPALLKQLRAICPGAFIMASNDCGRDIGGFTRLLDQVQIDRYVCFAFLHSKKSPHLAPEKGEYWRRSLIHAFAGTPEVARECVETFKREPDVGLVGAKEWRSQDMGANGAQYERLLDLLDVRGRNRELDYISGFMFVLRADVAARLYDVLRQFDFEYGGDRDLAFHIDGQIAHGVERAAPALVRQMGYEIRYQ